MGIVNEIEVACKALLDTFLVGYQRLDYEYDITNNSERSIDKRYGFISGAASFAEGRAMGFTTIDHTFTLVLVDDFQAKDDDNALREALFRQYQLSQNALKELQKSRLALPTVGNRVLLISGLSFDEPELFEDNSTVVLRANFTIRYSFKNN